MHGYRDGYSLQLLEVHSKNISYMYRTTLYTEYSLFSFLSLFFFQSKRQLKYEIKFKFIPILFYFFKVAERHVKIWSAWCAFTKTYWYLKYVHVGTKISHEILSWFSSEGQNFCESFTSDPFTTSKKSCCNFSLITVGKRFLGRPNTSYDVSKCFYYGL